MKHICETVLIHMIEHIKQPLDEGVFISTLRLYITQLIYITLLCVSDIIMTISYCKTMLVPGLK